MFAPVPLHPADILLYSKSDVFGLFTSLRTWSPAVHVEVYEDRGISLASRNGIGVNRYPLRLAQLAAVLRPAQCVNLPAIREWFEEPYNPFTGEGVRKRPYGWLDLLRFYGIKIATPGWICSQFAAKALRAGGINVFAAEYYEGTIDPGDFLLSPALRWQWIRDDVRKAVAT